MSEDEEQQETSLADKSVAYLGPVGTFTEQALYLQGDLMSAQKVPLATMPDVLGAVESGAVDWGFVAIENSIEGTVNIALDSLIFDNNLVVQSEVVMPIEMALIAPLHVNKITDIKRILTFPVAAAQCREFLEAKLPGVEIVAANSTADAVRQVSKTTSKHTAALGSAVSILHYDVHILADDVSDSVSNKTRFLKVAKSGIPASTGHDKTTIVVFQSADKPGNLHNILGQFSARNINLTKLESRPTKQQLGDYCFVIEFDGHVEDEVVADCLRDLHAQAKSVKFLGSYPSAGEHGPRRRRDAQAAWRAADAWITDIRSQVAPGAKRNRRFKVVK